MVGAFPDGQSAARLTIFAPLSLVANSSFDGLNRKPNTAWSRAWGRQCDTRFRYRAAAFTGGLRGRAVSGGLTCRRGCRQ